MGHTPTPWLYDEGEGEIYVRTGPLTKYIIADLECNADENGPYLIECVNSHASLVEEVERLREALKELNGALNDGLCNSGVPGFDSKRLGRAQNAAERILGGYSD